MPAGVFFVTPIPYQAVGSYPGADSLTVGRSGNPSERHGSASGEMQKFSTGSFIVPLPEGCLRHQFTGKLHGLRESLRGRACLPMLPLWCKLQRHLVLRAAGMAAILVVEDEEQVRVLAESYLREQGHETFSAATRDQALAVLDVERIDLLFVDIGLYEQREVGLDLAKEALERNPELKVLYTTGQPVTDGMKALFVGKSALLPKPYTVEQLQAVLAIRFGFKPVNVPTTPSVPT